MADKIKNVFISHHGKDDDSVQAVKTLLSNNGYQLKNSSIDSTRPNNASNEQYIKNEIIKPGINWAGTVVVLIGNQTHNRDYVNWEIECANKLGKRIVGVFIRGAKDSDLPDAFRKYGDALTGWNSSNIIDALNGKDNNWTNPDGSSYRNPYSPDRVIC